MYHISAKSAFGGREKNIWVQKAPGGCQIGYKRAPKRSGDVIFLSVFGYQKTAGEGRLLLTPLNHVLFLSIPEVVDLKYTFQFPCA